MKLNIYAIFDTASGLYLRPLFAQSDGQALRSFSDVVADADHEIGRHPEDYSISRLGIFDDNTGRLTNEDNECLLTGFESVAQGRNLNKNDIPSLDEKIKIGGTA